MLGLLSKTASRRMELIKMLYYSEGYVSLKDVSERLNHPVKVLKDDLHSIQSYDDILTIQSSNDKYSLDFHHNMGIEAVSREVLLNDLAFKLLDKVFFDDSLTVEQLSTELFTSVSTLYRHIHRVNRVLPDKYNITLQTNPFKLSGSEEDIRAFYTQFLAEKSTFFEWPFEEEVSEKELESFLLKVIDQVPVNIDYAYFRSIKFLAAVHLIRYRKGYRLSKPVTGDKDGLLNEVFIDSLPSNKYKRAFKIDITLEFLREVFSDFYDEMMCFSTEEFFKKAQHSPRIHDSFFYLINMINDLSSKYNLKINNRDVLMTDLNNTVVIGDTELYSHYILFDRKQAFVDSIEQEFPDFYHDVSVYIKEFLSKVHNRSDTILFNQMVYTLFTHWEGLFLELENQKEKISALIISNTDHLHAHMLKDFLCYEFTNQLTLTVNEELNINLDSIENSPYDIIITSFPIPDVGKTYKVCIENLPLQKDIEAIDNIIKKIRKK